MTGRVVHFEIPFDDGERAQGFYSEVFGWTVRGVPEMAYALVSTGPVTPEGSPSEPGFVNGGLLRRGDAVSTPVITIDVDDIDEALERVSAHGGATVIGRQDVGGMGFSAYVTDSEGNLIGLWQNASQ